MSEMWNVTVVNKGNDWIDLKLVLAYSEDLPFTPDPVFALELLCDEAYEGYPRVPICPLGEAIDPEKSLLPEDLKGRENEFIKSVTLYEVKNFPYDSEHVHGSIEKELIAEGFKKSSDEWERADTEKWNAYWDDFENLQQGKYRIYVTDPKWIEHLPIGHTYGTAAYSDDGPWIVENLSLDLPMPEDAQCRKQGVSGFWNSELPPRDSSMANEMIRDIAQSTGPLSPEDFSLAMKKHKIFLEQGTEGLKFTGLDAAGFPMTIIERQYGGMVGNSLVGEGYLEKLRKIANTNEGTHLAMIMRSVDPNTKLENENFTFSDWNGSYAKDAQFINCIFDRSLMTNGYYANANFEGSSFVGVDFTDSDLTNANFRNCNLTKADFEICNCDGADFTGANLSGASFKGASLNNVKR